MAGPIRDGVGADGVNAIAPRRLLIFDCDGVLVDSEYLSAQVLVETFAEIGVNIDLPFVYTHFLGHSFSSVAAKFAKLHGTGVRESFESDYRASLLRRFSTELKPMPGVIGVLDLSLIHISEPTRPY